MVDTASRSTQNPINEIARALGFKHNLIKNDEIELPIKLLFPTSLRAPPPGEKAQYMMLGLGDMALPGLLVALCLVYDRAPALASKRAARASAAAAVGTADASGLRGPLLPGGMASSPRAHSPSSTFLNRVRAFFSGYFGASLAAYTVGLFCALAAGLLSRAAQPALLYLAPALLGTILFKAHRAGELKDMWDAERPGQEAGSEDEGAVAAAGGMSEEDERDVEAAVAAGSGGGGEGTVRLLRDTGAASSSSLSSTAAGAGAVNGGKRRDAGGSRSPRGVRL
jgi:hypothetical protein